MTTSRAELPMLEAGDLLAGPRGRRLCLELATALDDDVHAVVHELAFAMDPGAGRSRVRLTSAGVVEELAGDVTVDVTTADLVALIDRLDLSAAGPDDLLAALARSADLAMYWQPPYGEDVVAALPDVASALEKVASVVAARAPRWWSSPRRAEQWVVEWRDPGDPVPLERDPARALRTWRAETIADEERSRRERPANPEANWSGRWWSTPGGVVMTAGTVSGDRPAGLVLVEDSLGWEAATAIPVRGAGRTYEIRDAADWADLCRRFPLEVSASRRPDWYRTTGRVGRWLIPDWWRVADEWDAVHLTVAGYLQAATRAVPIDDEYASVIGGWAPDTTAWLTDTVREWEGPRVVWRFDDSADRWEQDPGARAAR